MKRKIKYNKRELERTIELVRVVNRFAEDWTDDYIRDKIMACIDHIMREGISYAATIGFVVYVSSTTKINWNEEHLELSFRIESNCCLYDHDDVELFYDSEL